MSISQIQTRLSAWLPDGTPFVPGASNADPMIATCAGPDEHGECPLLRAGSAPPCQDATWVLKSASGGSWPFRFRARLHACPVTLLTGSPPAVGSAS
jgi:hypothetical protein